MLLKQGRLKELTDVDWGGQNYLTCNSIAVPYFSTPQAKSSNENTKITLKSLTVIFNIYLLFELQQLTSDSLKYIYNYVWNDYILSIADNMKQDMMKFWALNRKIWYKGRAKATGHAVFPKKKFLDISFLF